ncbi:MAG: DUF4272 domain-containing protein [Myxococcota bacterium]
MNRPTARHRLVPLLLACLAAPSCGDDDEAAPPAIKAAKPPPPEVPDEDGIAIRAATDAALTEAGFSPPRGLPTRAKRPGVEGKLRALHEIGGRAMALKAVITWATRPEAEVPSDVIVEYVKRSGLKRYLNETETGILAMDRGEANIGHATEVRWKLENLWALCWILGYADAPPVTGGRVSKTRADALMGEFVIGFSGDLKTFLTGATVRDELEVAKLEDLYYCAHGAARAASGEATNVVPETFDREIDGGSIHERRHALTWALSPKTAWDETDLTT